MQPVSIEREDHDQVAVNRVTCSSAFSFSGFGLNTHRVYLGTDYDWRPVIYLMTPSSLLAFLGFRQIFFWTRATYLRVLPYPPFSNWLIFRFPALGTPRGKTSFGKHIEVTQHNADGGPSEVFHPPRLKRRRQPSERCTTVPLRLSLPTTVMFNAT